MKENEWKCVNFSRRLQFFRRIFRSRTFETLSHYHVEFDEHIELSGTLVATESNVIEKVLCERRKINFHLNLK